MTDFKKEISKKQSKLILKMRKKSMFLLDYFHLKYCETSKNLTKFFLFVSCLFFFGLFLAFILLFLLFYQLQNTTSEKNFRQPLSSFKRLLAVLTFFAEKLYGKILDWVLNTPLCWELTSQSYNLKSNEKSVAACIYLIFFFKEGLIKMSK